MSATVPGEGAEEGRAPSERAEREPRLPTFSPTGKTNRVTGSPAYGGGGYLQQADYTRLGLGQFASVDADVRVYGTAVGELIAAGVFESVKEYLRREGDISLAFLRCHSGQFDSMPQLAAILPVPRVDPRKVRQWFGGVKQVPHIDLLVRMVSQGIPVQIAPGGDVDGALENGNNTSASQHKDLIQNKIKEDARYGRAFVFPRAAAKRIPGLRVSPLGVVVNPKKARIINDLRF